MKHCFKIDYRLNKKNKPVIYLYYKYLKTFQPIIKNRHV